MEERRVVCVAGTADCAGPIIQVPFDQAKDGFSRTAFIPFVLFGICTGSESLGHAGRAAHAAGLTTCRGGNPWKEKCWRRRSVCVRSKTALNGIEGRTPSPPGVRNPILEPRET
jgi:hypothetical protein